MFLLFHLLLQKLDQLSEKNQTTYQKHCAIINALKQDLQEKQQKYKDDKITYDHFARGLISSIEELQSSNDALLNASQAAQSTPDGIINFYVKAID